MTELSQQATNTSRRRASTPTVMLVLFAFLLNLFGMNAALAGIHGSAALAQQHQSGSAAHSQHSGAKPCHHNLASFGYHHPVDETGTARAEQTKDGLCCTDEDRTAEIEAALRSKRDREWLATTSEPNKVLPLSNISFDQSASFDTEKHQRFAAQISGVTGAQAQFLRTVRLLT